MEKTPFAGELVQEEKSYKAKEEMILQHSVSQTPTPTPFVTPTPSQSEPFLHRSVPDLKEYNLLDYATIYFHRQRIRFFHHISLDNMISYSHSILSDTLQYVHDDHIIDILRIERWLFPIFSGCPHEDSEDLEDSEDSEDNKGAKGHLTNDDKNALMKVIYELSVLRVEIDEIYCYALKMLKDNPSQVNELKGFEVLYILMCCFPPSNHLLNYCLRFCYDRLHSRNKGVSIDMNVDIPIKRLYNDFC